MIGTTAQLLIGLAPIVALAVAVMVRPGPRRRP